MKIKDGGGRHSEFMSGWDEDISIKCGGQMHHGRMEMIAGIVIPLLTTARWLSAYIFSIVLAARTISSYLR